MGKVLLENGSVLLLEDGSSLLLEEAGGTPASLLAGPRRCRPARITRRRRIVARHPQWIPSLTPAAAPTPSLPAAPRRRRLSRVTRRRRPVTRRPQWIPSLTPAAPPPASLPVGPRRRRPPRVTRRRRTVVRHPQWIPTKPPAPATKAFPFAPRRRVVVLHRRPPAPRWRVRHARGLPAHPAGAGATIEGRLGSTLTVANTGSTFTVDAHTSTLEVT